MSDQIELKKDSKKQWAKLRKESGATDEEKTTAKSRINAIEKELGWDVTVWDEKKPSSQSAQNEYVNKHFEKESVNWDDYKLGSSYGDDELNTYNEVVQKALQVVKKRHPGMNPNSNTFGTIVSAVTGHLIALRS